MTAPQTEAPAAATAGTARAAQLAIRAALMRDTTKLWPLLDPKRVQATFPAWLQVMQILIRNYHGQSSTAAGVFYRAARAHHTQSPAPTSLIRLAPPPDEGWVAKALGYAGPGLLERDAARPGTALSTVLGTSARIALDGGRTTTLRTVHHDPVAVGWYRVTDGHPCSFCALLASRGIAYKGRGSGFKAHNDCGCTLAPAFSRDIALPKVSQDADRIYTEHAAGAGSGKQLAAFRKAWAEHQASA